MSKFYFDLPRTLNGSGGNMILAGRDELFGMGSGFCNFTQRDVLQFKKIVGVMAETGAVDKELYDKALAAVTTEKGEDSNVKEGFLSVDAARKYLGGVSRAWLWQARKKGLMSHKIGGRVLFRPTELDDYVIKASSGNSE